MTKDLGWGWVPISWEGWLTVAGVFGAIVVSAIVLFGESIINDTDPPVANSFIFPGIVLGLVGLGALVSSKKTRP